MMSFSFPGRGRWTLAALVLGGLLAGGSAARGQPQALVTVVGGKFVAPLTEVVDPLDARASFPGIVATADLASGELEAYVEGGGLGLTDPAAEQGTASAELRFVPVTILAPAGSMRPVRLDFEAAGMFFGNLGNDPLALRGHNVEMRLEASGGGGLQRVTLDVDVIEVASTPGAMVSAQPVVLGAAAGASHEVFSLDDGGFHARESVWLLPNVGTYFISTRLEISALGTHGANAITDLTNGARLSLGLPAGYSLQVPEGVFVDIAYDVAIPEPATWGLLAGGMALAGAAVVRSRGRWRQGAANVPGADHLKLFPPRT